jgi:hypothetical protein
VSNGSPGGRYPRWLIGLTVGICLVGVAGTIYVGLKDHYTLAALFFFLTIVAAIVVPRGIRARLAYDAENRRAEASLEAESAKLRDREAGVSAQRGPAPGREDR